MPSLATQERPLRVAIIGGGPAGFFTAVELLKPGNHVAVDLFEKLPEPYGLIRYGVSPDHQHTRRVTKLFEPLNRVPRFAYFGHADIGTTVPMLDLRRVYNGIVIATAAQPDPLLGIPRDGQTDCHPCLGFAPGPDGPSDAL